MFTYDNPPYDWGCFHPLIYSLKRKDNQMREKNLFFSFVFVFLLFHEKEKGIHINGRC